MFVSSVATVLCLISVSNAIGPLISLPTAAITTQSILKANNTPDHVVRNKRATDNSVKKLIEKDNEVGIAALGHAGEYGKVQKVVSKLNTIESDHAPHFDAFEYLQNVDVNNLPDGIRNLVQEKQRLLKERKDNTNYEYNLSEIAKLDEEILRHITRSGKFVGY